MNPKKRIRRSESRKTARTMRIARPLGMEVSYVEYKIEFKAGDDAGGSSLLTPAYFLIHLFPSFLTGKV
jgi:hypothetical protein